MSSIPSPRPLHLLLIGLTWMGCYFLALLLLQGADLPEWQRAVLAAVPVVPFIGFMLVIVQQIRRLDELERRIHLEALAIAMPAAVLMLMTLGLLEVGGLLPDGEWGYRHVWMYLPALYFLGLAIATRRYR